MNTQTFETKNVLHHQFYGRQFINEELVYLNGIYYHYQFKSPRKINNEQKYEVIAADGNQLTIQQL